VVVGAVVGTAGVALMADGVVCPVSRVVRALVGVVPRVMRAVVGAATVALMACGVVGSLLGLDRAGGAEGHDCGRREGGKRLDAAVHTAPIR
jgi:hypothetical protein